MPHRFATAILSLLVLTGCVAAPPDEAAENGIAPVTIDADDVLDRFDAYVASYGLVEGERIHATAEAGAAAVAGTQLVPLDDQDCPVTPPAGPFAVRDVIVAPGRLMCSWTAGGHELTFTVFLDADLRRIEPTGEDGASGALDASRGTVRVADDGQQLWLQDTEASRMMHVRFAPQPQVNEEENPPVSPDLTGWVTRLAGHPSELGSTSPSVGSSGPTSTTEG